MPRSRPWGVKVNRIEIKDIVPPANLVQSMGRQMQAEREKRAEILTAEGQRQSAILKAEGQKQAQILEAEGRREAAFRDAEGRERLAQAEAKATEVVSAAVAKGDVASLNYFVAQKYLEAFGKFAQSPNQKTLIIPMEAMSVLGSLAGIGEIAKATFGTDGSGGGGRRRRQAARAAQPDRAVRLHDARLYAAEKLRERAMMEFLVSLTVWHWLIAAAVFFVLELIAPGAFMLWLGLSAMLVGIISFFVAWPWQYQLVAFAVFALASIPLWRRFARPRREGGRSAVPQPPRGRLRRPRVHAGEADRRRQRHGEDRRHDLAADRAGPARRQPRQGRARGRRDAGGGGGLEHDPEKWVPVFGQDHAPTRDERTLRDARAQQIVQMHDADRRAGVDHEHGGDLR